MSKSHRRKRSFVHEHSLSIAATTMLALWIGLYNTSSPATHVGSFLGNAIGDWTGVVVMVLATKFFFEKGSAESRPPLGLAGPVWRLRDHSLSIFLMLTGIGWTWLYSRMDSEAKWGQVVGSIVSDWTQLICLVLMTKRLVESHSKESNR